MNILVLGVTGMLGNAVFKYLKSIRAFDVFGTVRNKEIGTLINVNDLLLFDAYSKNKNQIIELLKKFKFDYIINCIGIINKYCLQNNLDNLRNVVLINAVFPHELSNITANILPNCRIIQIATDCVFSGKAGHYDENAPHDADDIYGITKSLGEVNSGNFLNIRCSIIGNELHSHVNLLDWFLSQKTDSILKGFINHKWNGVTTLQFARLCETIIGNNDYEYLRSKNNVVHFTPNETVSKYQLLCIFQEVYNTHYLIEKVEATKSIDRTLKSIFIDYSEVNDMKTEITHLKNFTNVSKNPYTSSSY